MADYVLFQMWEPFRQSLIQSHLFYLEQAQKRLLSQFGNIEAEADNEAEKYLEANQHRFDPDRDDPSDFYEAAGDARDTFYELLTNMRDQTQLSVVAGIYHEWDKSLRDWLVTEIDHWYRGDNLRQKIWKVNFADIVDLLECLGWKIKAADFYKTLDACRLVVNVYKHGNGGAFQDLKDNFPEYIDAADHWLPDANHGFDFQNFKHLKVNDEHIIEFSDAIVCFWKAIPENTFQSEVKYLPTWFATALAIDQMPQNPPNNSEKPNKNKKKERA